MIQLIEGKKHNIIKRDGRIEPYSEEKMRRVLIWATGGSEVMTEEILKSVNIKIYDKIKIEKLFDAVIETAANKISDMYWVWDSVARNLYIQKIYKELWGMKRDEYPSYLDVINKGLQYKVYDREVIESFTEEELIELGNYIKPERDFNFDYLGLRVFMDKYSKKYTTQKQFELPQHGFMRLAIYAFWKESDREARLEKIKKRYDDLSLFRFSEATPKWLNSLTPHAQMSSCVLTAMEDDAWSINHTVSNMGIYSKYGGGLACDISKLRCSGSTIKKAGVSSGPVPFVKLIESVVSSYNQMNLRQGAACVYFNWWHADVMDLLMLKDEGGTEDKRARKLKYAIKLNRIFFEKLRNNEEIYLFDPKETPELLESFGEEFEKWYEHYSQKSGIRKRKIKSVDLAYLIAKMRFETGNIYIFYSENVNEQTPFEEYVNSSNLCVTGDTKLHVRIDGREKIIEIHELSKYNGVDVEVLSRNLHTGQDEYKLITAFAQTGITDEIVILRQGKNEIRCTRDHKIYTVNRGYVCAEDITLSDTIACLDKEDENKGLSISYQRLAVPVYDITVQDNHNFYANNILVHNCAEIALPSRGSTLKRSSINTIDFDTSKSTIHHEIEPGLISLCNLSSINIVEWMKLSESDKKDLVDNLLEASDNLIDYAFYPVKEGEIANKLYRPIGIGISNLAQYFASKEILFTDLSRSIPEMTRVMEDIAYHIYSGSARLAAERGAFPKFYESKWAKGWLPIDIARQRNVSLRLEHDWEELRKKTSRGVRFITHLAIAPTACVTGDTRIRTEDGVKSYYQIMEENGINYEQLEDFNIPNWRKFKKPIMIPTRHGWYKAKRIWFNGKQKIRKLTFNDGTSVKCTLNHKFLVKKGDEFKWVESRWIEIGDEVLKLTTTSLEIIAIEDNLWEFTYDIEVDEVHEYFLENGVVSHNTSASIIGATESINPVKQLVSTKTGTYNCKQLAPNLHKYRQWYQTAWEVPNKVLLMLAAARQYFIDQAQSIDTFYQNAESAAELLEDIIFAEQLGIKTLYYANIQKHEIKEECESCSS